jgi:WD40 repeat protein
MQEQIMGLRLFISYARKDKFFIHQFVNMLREGGHDAWFDHEIPPGQDWKEELLKQIRLCQVFIYALTPRSVRSGWCLWEFDQAVAMNKRVFPVLIEKGGEYPEKLARLQYADLTDDNSHIGAARLIGELWKMAVSVSDTRPIGPESPDGVPAEARAVKEIINTLSLKKVACMKTLKGHAAGVQSVAFDWDSELLASASWDKSILLWQVPGGQKVYALNGHFDAVNSVAFSPMGDWLASGSRDRTIKLWKKANVAQAPLTLIGHDSYVNYLTFSADGELLISASGSNVLQRDNTVKIWEMTSRPPTTLFNHDQAINSVAYSAQYNLIASASDDATIKLWKMGRQQSFRILTGHSDAVNIVTFSPDGSLLASGSKDRTIKLWDMPSGNEMMEFSGHRDAINGLSFSPDGSLLASGSKDGTIKLWEIRNIHELRTLQGHTDGVTSVTFSPDGAYLASASWDHTVKLWGIDSNRDDSTATKPVWRVPPRPHQ